jgi:hypothetical protein
VLIGAVGVQPALVLAGTVPLALGGLVLVVLAPFTTTSRRTAHAHVD